MFTDNKGPFFYELFQTFVFVIVESIDVVETQFRVLFDNGILALVNLLGFVTSLLKIRYYLCELKTKLVVRESKWNHLDAY